MTTERKLRWMQRAMIAQFFVVLSLVALQGSYQNVAWKQLSYDASGNLQIAAPSGKAVVFSDGLQVASGKVLRTPTLKGLDGATLTIAAGDTAGDSIAVKQGAGNLDTARITLTGGGNLDLASNSGTILVRLGAALTLSQGFAIPTGRAITMANGTALTGDTGTEGLSVSQAVVTTQLILVEVADPGAAAANTVRLFTDSTSDDVMANFDAGSVTVATKP
jgi:hypothetical protein